MNSDEASKKQDHYVRSRLVWELEILLISSTLEALIKSVSSSLQTLDWSDEERPQIRKIETALRGILELHQSLANLLQPLIPTYRKAASIPTTSTQSPMPMDVGDAIT